MAMYFVNSFFQKEPETQEQVQTRIDKLEAKAFNAVLVSHMYAVVSDMFLPFYAPPCGLPTPNGMVVLALARRLARENKIDTEYYERQYVESSNTKVVEAEEGMLLEQD